MQISPVFSSELELPDHYLQGFAFYGPDLVLGDEGYGKFRENRKRLINPGEDGSFFVVNRNGRTHTIGSDFGAYTPIYYFKDDQYWSVSSSFHDLAEFLFSKNKRLSLNRPATALKRMPKVYGEQPCTHETPVNGIMLLPPNKVIQVRKGLLGQKFEIADRPKLSFQEKNIDYEERMFEYVRTWISRHCTMLTSNLRITVDITGGTDSRASLALCLKAAEIAGVNLNKRVHFNSNRKMQTDLEISNQIGKHYGFEVGRNDLKFFPPLEGELAYKTWLSRSLHSYWPFYGSNIQRRSDHVWLGGGGGEAHRWNTGAGTPEGFERFLRTGNGILDHDENSREFLKILSSDLFDLSKDPMQPSVKQLIYFRNFRERFHHGRRSLVCNAITPLSGGQLDFASRLLDTSQNKAHQAHVDIAEYCAPDLKNFPLASKYDQYAEFGATKPIRAISANTIETSGIVHAGDPPNLNANGIKRNTIEHLKSDFERCASSGLELGISTQEDLHLAKEIITNHTTNANFENPRIARPVVSSIWAGKIARWVS